MAIPMKLRDEEWALAPVAPGKWQVSVLGLPPEIVSEEILIRVLKNRGLSDSEIKNVLQECMQNGKVLAQDLEKNAQFLSTFLMDKVEMALKMLAPLIALGDWRVMNAINILTTKIRAVRGKEAQVFYSIPEIIKALQAYRSDTITKKDLDYILLRLP